jgi:uncharacterized protein YjbJ (UPF0337 family)
MDWNRIKANWKELKGQAKNRWGELTDDDLAEIDGKRERLLGKLEKHYSLAKEELERDIDQWGRGEIHRLDSPR